MPWLRKIPLSEHLETKKRLKEIPSISTFDELLDRSTLDDIDKKILRLYYLKHRDFRFIGESLGFAEVTIKKRHRKALSKLTKLL